jgi:hypothetical protein
MSRLEDASSCDACPPVAPSVVLQLSRVSQIDVTSSYLKSTLIFSSSLSLSRARAIVAAADFTDAAGLPPVLNLSQGNESLLTEYIFNLTSFIDVRNF